MKTTEYHLPDYLTSCNEFAQLSLRDLLEAREQYHIHLMRHPNVVATAVGRYRIRKSDSWPTSKGSGGTHGKGVRTLENSEVRPYSWPAILVFVEKWESAAELATQPGGAVPKTLYLPDERSVPVCVIEAPREARTEIEARDMVEPINNIGGGSAVIAEVQGRRYAATIACLVSDGHKVYGLTNRHVTGDEGEVVFSRRAGKLERIGVSSGKQLTREEFARIYPGWPGKDVFVNLDVGLIDIDNLDQWTADVRTIGEMGPMADLATSNYLALIGSRVRGIGAASGQMLGEIHALFYRYKTQGGFEYIADLLIGPRSETHGAAKNAGNGFATHPGDSGALWLLEPREENGKKRDKNSAPETNGKYLPLAMEWGRNMLNSAGRARPQSYALATMLARVCAELEVDPVRNWNLGQVDTWGAIGHFSIANRTQVALSNRFPKLVKLMGNNGLIISHDDETIVNGEFKGMGKSEFVALADVPDFFWKSGIAKQGHARFAEGPNHFADMDQPNQNGKTLLDLCQDPAFIDPDKWNAFYDSVADLMTGDPIAAKHRGLLPFRVWQIFDEMKRFAFEGNASAFVCAAGVLTHYIGDACQPLHISYLHDGDPLRKFEHVFTKGKKAGQSEFRALGTGVHSAYEDDMVSAFSDKILAGLAQTPKAAKTEKIKNGNEAAIATIGMMRSVFNRLPPMAIVDAFIAFDGKPKDRPAYMWKKFGKATIKAMQSGSHLLAVLWENAWALGEGETRVASTAGLTHKRAMTVCAKTDFLPSYTVDQIGAHLKHPN
jgi:hypothetical protein